MPLAASIALAVSLALSNIQTSVPDTKVVAQMPVAQNIGEYTEQYVRDEFADVPVMIEIALCESRFNQFDKNRNVLMNHEGSSAKGIFQIMASIHEKGAAKMGMDINTIEGNVAYARYLFDTQGTKPWEADLKSKRCWGKTEAAQIHLALN